MKTITHAKIKQGDVMIASPETGEIISLGTAVIQTTDRKVNKDFFMIFNPYNKKTEIFEIDLLMYLMQRMSNKNTIMITDEKIAKDFKTTRQRVARVKQKLKKCDLIKYTGGTIMINPTYIYRGTAYKREERINEYWEMKGIGSDEAEK